jgi:hypothetical protein
MSEPTTKICDWCDQEIGANETKCPKCQTEFEEAEQEIGVVSRALTAIEKRKAREKAKADAEAEAARVEEEKKHPKKKSIFKSLGRTLNK